MKKIRRNLTHYLYTPFNYINNLIPLYKIHTNKNPTTILAKYNILNSCSQCSKLSHSSIKELINSKYFSINTSDPQSQNTSTSNSSTPQTQNTSINNSSISLHIPTHIIYNNTDNIKDEDYLTITDAIAMQEEYNTTKISDLLSNFKYLALAIGSSIIFGYFSLIGGIISGLLHTIFFSITHIKIKENKIEESFFNKKNKETYQKNKKEFNEIIKHIPTCPTSKLEGIYEENEDSNGLIPIANTTEENSESP